MESTSTEGAPVAEVLNGLQEEVNAIGDTRQKRQGQKHAHHGQQFTRAEFLGRQFPGKIWMPTNQIRVIPTNAHVSRELRARAPQVSRGI